MDEAPNIGSVCMKHFFGLEDVGDENCIVIYFSQKCPLCQVKKQENKLWHRLNPESMGR